MPPPVRRPHAIDRPREPYLTGRVRSNGFYACRAFIGAGCVRQFSISGFGSCHDAHAKVALNTVNAAMMNPKTTISSTGIVSSIGLMSETVIGSRRDFLDLDQRLTHRIKASGQTVR